MTSLRIDSPETNIQYLFYVSWLYINTSWALFKIIHLLAILFSSSIQIRSLSHKNISEKYRIYWEFHSVHNDSFQKSPKDIIFLALKSWASSRFFPFKPIIFLLSQNSVVHTMKMSKLKKTITGVGKDVEKLKLSFLADVNIK